MTIRELYNGDASRWTKEQYARDRLGQPSNPYHPSTVCWCLSGAAERAYPPGPQRAKVYEIIDEKAKEWGYIDMIRFNDDPDTTFLMVSKLLEECGV